MEGICLAAARISRLHALRLHLLESDVAVGCTTRNESITPHVPSGIAEVAVDIAELTSRISAVRSLPILPAEWHLIASLSLLQTEDFEPEAPIAPEADRKRADSPSLRLLPSRL
ncbi:hypothetical protein B296_00023930 [Ensete ventricosum]|uniref:Uncharacterized protein n=1 Tax=Ensete ventricosum TaxID=4639 RepID=A0A427AJW8_ENSVE|nr:hypothetical protein B296_00023930 [Ensete ventricosum]